MKTRYRDWGAIGNLHRWAWKARLAGWWYWRRRGGKWAAKAALNNVDKVTVFEA